MSEISYLDPEIANEGQAASLEMPDMDYQTPMERPHIPDYSWLKPTDKLAKYFPHISGIPYRHKPFPAWFFHKSKPPILIQDVFSRNEDPPRLLRTAADQAKKLGIEWRKSTREEIAQGYKEERWVCTGEWSSVPFETKPDIHGAGKTLPPPTQANSIAAAVTAAMKAGGGAASKTTEMIGAVVAAVMAAMKAEQNAKQEAEPEKAAEPPQNTLSAAPAGKQAASHIKSKLDKLSR